MRDLLQLFESMHALDVTNGRKQSSILTILEEKIKISKVLYFSLPLPLNYLPLASQYTKCSISFTQLLNL